MVPLSHVTGGDKSLAWRIFAVIVPLLVAFAIWRAADRSQSHAPKSSASSNAAYAVDIAARYLDFGEQAPQSNFTWELPLENTTDHEVEILSFEKSCSCSSLRPEALILAAGESRRIKAVLDLLPQNDEELSKQVREFAVTIRPILKGGLEQGEWQVRGRVVNPYHVEPVYLHYGDSLVQGTSFPNKEIVVSGFWPLAELNATCDPPKATAVVQRVNGSDTRYLIQVSIDESLPVGYHDFTVQLRGTTQDGHELAPGGVRGFAKVVSDIDVFPPVIHLGTLKRGQRSEADVTLRSRTGSTLELLDVDNTEANFVEVTPGWQQKSSQLFQITGRGDAIGGQVARVYFRVKSSLDGATHQIPLTVAYTGLVEAATFSKDRDEPPLASQP